MDSYYITKAIKNDDYDFIRKNLPSLPKGEQMNSFYYAISSGKFEMIQLLISLECNIKTTRRSVNFQRLISFVQMYDRPDIVEALKDHGFNLNNQDNILLSTSVQNKNFKTSSFLLTTIQELDDDVVFSSLSNLLSVCLSTSDKYCTVKSEYPLISQFKKLLTKETYNSLLESKFKTDKDKQTLIQLRHMDMEEELNISHHSTNQKKIKI